MAFSEDFLDCARLELPPSPSSTPLSQLENFCRSCKAFLSGPCRWHHQDGRPNGFREKKFEITFPRFTRQQKRCKRCKVHRQDAWSVSAGTITESKWSFWSLTIWHTNLSLTEKTYMSLNIRSHAFGLRRCIYIQWLPIIIDTWNKWITENRQHKVSHLWTARMYILPILLFAVGYNSPKVAWFIF